MRNPTTIISLCFLWSFDFLKYGVPLPPLISAKLSADFLHKCDICQVEINRKRNNLLIVLVFLSQYQFHLQLSNLVVGVNGQCSGGDDFNHMRVQQKGSCKIYIIRNPERDFRYCGQRNFTYMGTAGKGRDQQKKNVFFQALPE